MTTIYQSIVAVTITVLVSLLALAGINRFWPCERRRRYNDLIGWQLSVLGTIYAVILGFMLYTVWTSYGEADLNVTLEANAVVDIFRLTDGLPEPQRTQLRMLAHSYVDTVIERDWPEMAKGELPEQTTVINEDMWRAVMSVKTTIPTEITAQGQVISQVESLAQRRLIRILHSKARLPNVLWCVLLVGGGLTIILGCTFGAESVKLQFLEVFCLSLFISLALVAIASIHQPFRGVIHVGDYAFQRARQRIEHVR